MIEIDGSLHSGSEIVVRQAVAYAALTGQPVRIRNAPARRPRPGLRLQPLRAIQAIAGLIGGVLDGAKIGSRLVEFQPGDAEPAGQHTWDIGSAGSATVLALAVLPVMALRGWGTRAEIRGVFQDFAPSVFHFQHDPRHWRPAPAYGLQRRARPPRADTSPLKQTAAHW
jgi:RNA 3'-terminal phosphate cyclase (ATP)